MKENTSKLRSKRYGSKPGLILAWSLGTAVLLLVFVVLSTQYVTYVRGTIRQESKRSLDEMGEHIAQSLSGELDATAKALGGLALGTDRYDFAREEDLLTYLREQAAYWGFYDLALIDGDGICHRSDGSLAVPMDRGLLSEALKTGESTYDFRMAGGEDCIVFYSPIPSEQRGPHRYLAVTGAYAVRNWDAVMDIDSYERRAVTHVVTRDGVVITQDRQTEGQAPYNLLESLRNAEFESGTSLENVRQALLNEECLQVSYRLDGTEYYLDCEPLSFNGWTLTSTIPSGIVNGAGDNMLRSVLLLCVCLAFLFLFLLLLFQLTQYHARKRLWSMAYQDDITGGANKHRFEEDARTLLANTDRRYMLAYVNIRQFKMLNRRFGKAEADRLLTGLHRAMERLLTPQECCGRLFADNFVLLLEEGAPDSTQRRMKSLIREQSTQRASSGTSYPIRLVVGLCPVDDRNLELTQIIDQANLSAKTLSSGGEENVAVYDRSMMEQAAREKEMTEQLRRGDVYREFSIRLQPKVDLATGRVVGAEALSRWESPVLGPVSPGEFIPLAERLGTVNEIDWAAFDQVCQVLSGWLKEGKEPIPISFNLSKSQLVIPHFLDHYREVILRYGIPCRLLEFEFTESILYENADALRKAVEEIHQMGCQCSVDDFGFGYSSLGLLGQFDADTLKLDRSFFLEDARPDSRNNRIVHSVIQMASGLGMHTVAEGVEDHSHVEMLRSFGCGSIQGFVFAKPLTRPDFEQFVREREEGGLEI